MKSCQFLFAMLVLLTGCVGGRQSKYERPATTSTAILKTTLRGLNLTDPGADLKINVGNGDYRFIGVHGIVTIPVGLQKEDMPLLSQYGLRGLDGTSDAIENNEHGALMQDAFKYAERYNQLLLKYLRSKGAL